MLLRISYAVSGTDVGDAPTGRCALSAPRVLRLAAASGTIPAASLHIFYQIVRYPSTHSLQYTCRLPTHTL
eukprot:3941595-Rhodomonas_salina.2